MKKIAQQNKIAQKRRLTSSKGMGILPIEEDLNWEARKEDGGLFKTY